MSIAHFCLKRRSLVAVFAFLATGNLSLLQAETDFQLIATTGLPGTDGTAHFSVVLPSALESVHCTLEFTPDPESVPWQSVPGTIISPASESNLRNVITRTAANGTGYYRMVALAGSWAPVVINEVMPNNTDTLEDEDGEFPDWIELHNLGEAEIALEGFGLSDDPENPLRWTFAAESVIAPNGYLVVFLSGNDRPGDANAGVGGTAPHTNFRLSNGRETVFFSNPAGTVLDKIQPGPLRSDRSLARSIENPLEWFEFDGTPAPTPGAANDVSSGTLPSPYRQPPVFSIAPGFYTETVAVTMSPSHPGDLLYFTTDGSVPDPDDETTTELMAGESMPMEETTVLRAIAVGADGKESEPATGTYFIGAEHSLPVLSISADPDAFEFRNGSLYGFGERLFSRSGRIIGNFPWTQSNAWQDREIPANIEMYENDLARSQAFNEVLGIKIFGGWGSRGYPQKSFAVFARSRRGTGRIQHQIFPDKEITSFESFVLRNSGNDNQSTHLTVPRSEIREFSTPASYGSYFVNGNFTLFRDAMLTSLARDIGLDTQGYRPSAVYINGDYWGIYNIREKLNEHYVESNHGVPENQVDLIEGYGSANSGSSTEYNRMRNYISGRDMADPERYQFVADNYLHIDNFIDYHLAVIFFQNFDIGNIKCWRPRIDGGKFRWLVYDQDYGFHLWKPDVYLPAMRRDFSDYDNMFRFYTNSSGSGTGWPNAGGRTVLLRKLLDNDDFKRRFIIRCADLLNTTFATDYVTTRIDQMAAGIRAEIPNHLERWSWAAIEERGFGHPHKEEDEPLTLELWESHVQGMRDYAAERPGKLRSDLISHFRLDGGTGIVSLSVDPPDAGAIQAHTIPVTGTEATPWAGTWFEDFPPPLTPLPKPGWTLANWSGDTIVDEANEEVLARVSSDAVSIITAHFEPATLDPAHAAIIINEIHYHPADRQPGGEWVEIWNTGEAEIVLSDWKLYDDNDQHAFAIPNGTLIESGAKLVIAASPEAFSTAYPDTTNVVGGFAYRFGNGGDTVRLVDDNGAFVDSVPYDDESPWAESPDGDGYTLQRLDPQGPSDNPTNWKASDQLGGTPGS